ncbi:MAG: segregation/condensation protein A, partial [Nanoarchaeota archaeon]
MDADENNGDINRNNSLKQKVGQDQIHGLLFGNNLSWQSIIYDLINTEQLDPWGIDICLLSNKYLERVQALEEANFFVSSKVLFAASLLLRIKSEILLNQYLPSLDEILFGKKEEKQYVQEKIELDDEIPGLVPRTPLPRFRKVSLQELMSALGKAITTENRRIKRVIIDRERALEAGIVLPKRRYELKAQVDLLYKNLKDFFSSNNDQRVPFSRLFGDSIENKLAFFLPLLHLDNQHKVLAEQENHFDEIYIWMKEIYNEKHAS